MKTAIVIILLAALVCSAVCDPDRPEEQRQTAEAEGYGYGSGGRSRSKDYDNDDSYGYKDGYAAKRRGPMPRVYPDDDDDYASKQTCLCSTNLSPTTINSGGPGKCTTAATCGNPPAYCENSQVSAAAIPGPGAGCTCATVGAFGTSATFGLCGGNQADAGGGGLCLQFTCPIDGTINIQGQAVPAVGAAPPCGCGVADFLYIYKGTAFTSNAGDILANNQQSADVTVNCKKNDNFYVCEKAGIIITSTVKATFFAQSSGACTTLGNSNTWTTQQCKNC